MNPLSSSPFNVDFSQLRRWPHHCEKAKTRPCDILHKFCSWLGFSDHGGWGYWSRVFMEANSGQALFSALHVTYNPFLFFVRGVEEDGWKERSIRSQLVVWSSLDTKNWTSMQAKELMMMMMTVTRCWDQTLVYHLPFYQ